MANKATADGVRADMAPPNYRSAVQIIRTTKAKKDRISGINGEIAGIFAKVEGFKVNRKAGKIFAALDNMEADERNDVMRSLNGLFEAAGYEAEDAQDLVDMTEGAVVHLRFGKQPADAEDGVGTDEIDEALNEGEPGDDIDEALAGDDFVEASDEELAKQAGRGESKRKDAARKQLDQADPKPGTGAAAMKTAGETYTGDNSDLANTAPQGAA